MKAKHRLMWRAPITSTPPRLADYWVIALSLAAQARSSSNEKALIGGGGRQTAPGNWTAPHLFARRKHPPGWSGAVIASTYLGLSSIRSPEIFWDFLGATVVLRALRATPGLTHRAGVGKQSPIRATWVANDIRAGL